MYDNLIDDYDYFAFGGDDSFWVVPNLRHYLLTDPRILDAEKDNQPLYMGILFCYFSKNLYYTHSRAVKKVPKKYSIPIKISESGKNITGVCFKIFFPFFLCMSQLQERFSKITRIGL